MRAESKVASIRGVYLMEVQEKRENVVVHIGKLMSGIVA